MKWPLDRWDSFGAMGGSLVVAGVACWSIPAALIVAGAIMAFIGIGGGAWVSSRR